MFATVVSVVAEVAKPETAEEEIAIATFDALVNLPVESTTNVGTELDVPYPVAATVVAGNLAEDNVPEVILLALVTSVVADVANPDIFAAASDVIQEGFAYDPFVYTPFVTVPEFPVILVTSVPELFTRF